MNTQIDDIIDQLYNKYDIPRTEIAKIVKSQFKVLRSTINEKGFKTINLIYIGKFKPRPFRLKLEKTKNGDIRKT